MFRLRGWWLLGLVLFVVGHVSALALNVDVFNDYTLAAEIATHVFSVPAIIRARQVRLTFSSEIIVSVLASIVYHSVRNYTTVDYEPYQRLDHGLSTGLICVVFLKYVVSVHHVVGLLLLLATLASSLDVGNILSSSVTALVLTAAIALPLVDKTAQSVVRTIIQILTLGATPPQPVDLQYNMSQRVRLLAAFGFQIASVYTYFQGESDSDMERFWHSLWHAFAYSALYLLTDVVADKKSSSSPTTCARKRKHRKEYSILSESVSRRAPLIGFRFT